MAIGLGEWGDGAASSQRRSIGLQCRTTDDEIQFMVIEPDQSPWGRKEFLGRMLPRETALQDSAIKEFFQIAERVVDDDPRVSNFIKGA